MKCNRCQKELKGNDVVCVVNRNCWCEECFNNYILPDIKMTVHEYFKSMTEDKTYASSN